MKVEPGQVYLVRHSGREDPFLIVSPREAWNSKVDYIAFKWNTINLTNMEEVYMYDSELANPSPIEKYYAIERLF